MFQMQAEAVTKHSEKEKINKFRVIKKLSTEVCQSRWYCYKENNCSNFECEEEFAEMQIL